MKRVLILLVSALLAGTTYASNLSKDIVAKVTNSSEVSVTKQGQSLVLEQKLNKQTGVNTHYSHSSHASHASHVSHYSSRF